MIVDHIRSSDASFVMPDCGASWKQPKDRLSKKFWVNLGPEYNKYWNYEMIFFLISLISWNHLIYELFENFIFINIRQRSTRLASLVGITERETGVDKLGWYGNFTEFDRKNTLNNFSFFFFFPFLRNERKRED